MNPTIVEIKRLNINGMITEYALNGDSVIVMIGGLPGVPKQKEEIIDFTNKGFSVFFPRQLGTWESTGVFLRESPAIEINDLLFRLKNGIEIEGKTMTFRRVYILATSFGGYVSFNLNYDNIDKAVLMSPVHDFKKVQSIETLENFLRGFYPGAYRFAEGGWEKLINNGFSNFDSVLKNTNKLLVLIGHNDKAVLMQDTIDFCKQNNIEYKTYLELGHITFSTLKVPEIKENILETFSEERI